MAEPSSRRVFELGVYDAQGERTHLVRDLLASGADLSWYTDDDSVVVVRDEGGEHLREDWNLGSLSRVTTQLEGMAPRLEQGRRGVLRSAVCDEARVPFLLFEPAGSVVRVAVFFVPDPTLRFVFPDEAGPRGEALLAWVAQRADLLAGPACAAVPRAQLVTDVRQAIAWARELLARSGR